MKIKKGAALAAALGIAFAGLSASIPASAEPVVPNSDSAGVFGPFAVVGSDTLESVLNSLTNGTHGVTVAVAGGQVANYNAFGSTLIQTKAGQPLFPRPSGSGAGVAALRASVLNTAVTKDGITYPAGLTGDIDIARSSSGAGSDANALGDLVYIPFAQDALGYIYNTSGLSAGQIDLIDSLTKTQLKAIYEAGIAGANTTVAITDGTFTVNVEPRLPQAASGTRKDFISKIGASTLVTTSTYAWEGSGATGTPENSADVVTGSAEIMPFSISNYIAQANGMTADNTTDAANVALGAVGGLVPLTGTAPNLVADSTYYATANMGRTTYVVVEYARVQQFLPDGTTPNPKYSARLATLVSPSGGNSSLTSFVTTGVVNTAGKVKARFGFLAPATLTQDRAFDLGAGYASDFD